MVKKEQLKKNDLQERVAPNISKDYMDISNPFLCQIINYLDTSIKILNCGYFLGKNVANKNESPVRNGQVTEDYTNENFTMDIGQRELLNGINNPYLTQTIDTANMNSHGTINTINNNQVTRESISMLMAIKSP